MRLQFYGAARTVTGSCHLLQVGKKKILLDCGLYQGKRKESFKRNRTFKFDPKEIDCVVLSHTHIDHSGNIPRLVASGFRGPIFCTHATLDLCDWMLRDSAYIQERDVEHVNKRRRKKKQTPFEPLYTIQDAVEALTRFRGVDYNNEVEITEGVGVKFRDAGHILGSASCHLRCREGDSEKLVVFTGDVGRHDRVILRDPVPPKRADVLICESTYGNRIHEESEDTRARLLDVAHETFDRGGKLLIPAFSVGRTQTLVYHFNALFNERKLPPMPIFVDSPLATNVTSVFRAHPECYDDEASALCDLDRDPFGFRRLTYIRDVEASKALNELHVPCIIISASGMCEAGRVIHHLKRVAPDPKSTVLVVGYMAPHTVGRRLVERAESIKLFGTEYPLKARVETTSGLSGHADRDELLDYLSLLKKPPARTFLVHGEEEAAEAFAEALRQKGYPDVQVPRPEQAFRL